jgi:hypothetical protein
MSPERHGHLRAVVRDALATTHAMTTCPFHPDVTIRIGDDAAETHAFYRARNALRSEAANFDSAMLMNEIARQVSKAADRVCPKCSKLA